MMFDNIRNFRAPNVFNPWRDVDPADLMDARAPIDRMQRLGEHFACTPQFLLIGEAPGYQGCHFSGIPFTNEKLLLDGAIPRIKTIGSRITRRPQPWCEPSATIMWKELHRLNIADVTVMWNAFAWHPHKPGEPMSNRAPTPFELCDPFAQRVLHAVVDRFRGARVVAVGRVAEKALKKLGVDTLGRVRHPAMGGATEFRQGLANLISVSSAA